MNAPLACFLEGLIASSNSLISGPEQVKIVSDNCGQLPERARNLVRLSYTAPRVCERWEESTISRTCDAPAACRTSTSSRKKTIKKSQEPNSGTTLGNNQGCPVLPHRRTSLGAGEDRWSSSSPCGSKDQCPPRDPTERSKLRWAMALDDLLLSHRDDSTDSESEDDDDSTYYGDDCSSCNSSDSEDDESDSDSENDGGSSDSSDEDGGKLAAHWAGNLATTPHQWTLPPNCILPSIQAMIRKAGTDQNFDMNQYLLSLAQPIP
jgi:hypothetical protein